MATGTPGLLGLLYAGAPKGEEVRELSKEASFSGGVDRQDTARTGLLQGPSAGPATLWQRCKHPMKCSSPGIQYLYFTRSSYLKYGLCSFPPPPGYFRD